MSDKTEYDFVGQTRLLLDVDGGSPFARCVIPKWADAGKIIAAIRTDIREAFERHCLCVSFLSDRIGKQIVDKTYMSEPKEIKPQTEENAEWERNCEELGKSFRAASDSRIRSFETNPDNGKHGYWNVDGVRHSGFVLASSEAEAVQKAIDGGVVGDWEGPTATYVGERPEVMG